MMKWLMLVVAVTAVNVNANVLNIYNNTQDSFYIKKEHMADSKITIFNDSAPEDESYILPGGAHTEYRITYSDECPYKMLQGPSLLFQNDKGRFSVVFLGRITKLFDDSATEVYSKSYYHEYITKEGGQGIGSIMSWFNSGPHRVVYCRESDGRGQFTIVIEYITDSKAWMDEVKEGDFKRRMGFKTKLKLQQQPEPDCEHESCCSVS
jgi:hypothetical protein